MGYIVTIEPSGVPHVLSNAMHEAGDDSVLLSLAAKCICERNPKGSVVWVLDADGELPWFRYAKEGSSVVETQFTYHPWEETA